MPEAGAHHDALTLIAAHFGVPLETVTPEADFRRDLGADSLDLVSFTLAVEERYDIEISDDESEHCLDVRAALQLLASKLGPA